MVVSLKAKWGKVEFDIPIEDSLISSPDRCDCILSVISSKTNIPKDKIKVIPATALNGGTIKDGMKVTIIGTAADQQLSASTVPSVPTQFIEDMTDVQIAAALRLHKMEPLPIGLENLGNTCYLNSVVQCLLWLPGFRDRIATVTRNDNVLLNQLKSLARTLHSADSAVADSFTPSMFVGAVRSAFPQFNQRDDHGHFAQQDADEFLRAVLHAIGDDITDPLFGFMLESKWTCLETAAASSTAEVSPSEDSKTVVELLKSLTCHIGTQLEPISHLHEGIQLSLKETIYKESAVLGRTAKFEKHSGLASLPEYLVVQLARFQWKAKSDSAGTAATKTKIVRKINFQKNLDVYEFCTSEVKAGLDVGRERRRILLEQGAALEDIQGHAPVGLQFDNSLGRLATGTYELVAISSHEGRTADSGHYMAYAKRRPIKSSEPTVDSLQPPNKKAANEKEEYWVKFDDDVVSETTWSKMSDSIMGGLADSQMAYLLFYAKSTVPEQQ